MRIYLSGSREEIGYRDYVLEKYSNKLNLFEPIRTAEDNILPKHFNWTNYTNNIISLSEYIVNKIVLNDKSEIKRSDIVVVYVTKYSAGTIMEIVYSYINKVPIFVIDPTRKFRKDIWIRYHTSKFFDSIDECFEYILLIRKCYDNS